MIQMSMRATVKIKSKEKQLKNRIKEIKMMIMKIIQIV